MPDQDQKTSEGFAARKQAGTAASIADRRDRRIHATRYSRRTVASPKRPDASGATTTRSSPRKASPPSSRTQSGEV
jgi:hypothetical protein